MDINIKIIYEDKNIIVLEKPAGMPSQPDKTGDTSVMDELSAYFGREYKTIIHRLDRPVGGLMVFGKTAESVKKLSEAVKNKIFNKNYYAVCLGILPEGKIVLKDYIAKDNRKNLSFISSEEDKNAREAVLEMECMETMTDEKLGEISLVSINLITGRHHQIRLQLSNAGYPVLGDRKYGKRTRGVEFPALYSGSIGFRHPVSGKEMRFEKTPEYYPFTLFDFVSINERNV